MSALVGNKAPDFTLEDESCNAVILSEVLEEGPTVLAFYPGDFKVVCTAQMCNYRDHISDFRALGVRLFGISRNPPDSHARFKKQYDIPFSLLSDPHSRIAQFYGCKSYLLLGAVSRAVFILASTGYVLYRYVEPTTMTRRNANELVAVLRRLKQDKLLV